MIPDEGSASSLSPGNEGYSLTPEGEAALDASLGETEDEPTVVVARGLSVREEIPAP